MKKITLFGILIITLLVAGCSGPSGVIRNSDGTSDYNARTGGEGLEIKFVRDNPPLITYDTAGHDPFPLMIELWNKGSTNIGTVDGKNGYLVLSGIDDNILQGLAHYKIISNLKGKSPYNSYGGYQIYDFSCNNIHGESCVTQESEIVMPYGVAEYRPTIQVSACYSYETIATPTICVDGNPYVGVDNKPCRAGQIDMPGTQGGPVAVTRIEQISMPDAVQFRIDVQNVGRGKVVSTTSIIPPQGNGNHPTPGMCPFTLSYEKMDVLDYQISGYSNWIDANSFSCEPAPSEFRLVDGKGTIFCNAQLNTKETFQTPLTITLTYGYMESMTQPVTVKNLVTG